MTYFSRLTDIVTCNLSSILARVEDQKAALEQIIYEMNEGVSGAERSVNTASQNVVRIEIEIGEQQEEIAAWMKQAQAALTDGQEVKARQALERKHEVEDLIAGLEQQLEAAISTRDHLRTMMNALHARLSDANRRLKLVVSGEVLSDDAPTVISDDEVNISSERKSRVDAELEALRKQMEVK